MTTGSTADGAGDVPLASPGARCTREEEEELVAAVRAGTDLAVIAERHGRTLGGITSRLLKLIPAGEDIPVDERLGWITARLADPGFDRRTPLAQPRLARRDSVPQVLPTLRCRRAVRDDAGRLSEAAEARIQGQAHAVLCS